MAAFTRSSSTALFLAAILLLAAASAVAQAEEPPAPGEPSSSPCPAGIDDLLSDNNISPLGFIQLTLALNQLGSLDAAQCLCDGIKSVGLDGGSSEAATALLARTLDFFDMTLPDGFMCNVD